MYEGEALEAGSVVFIENEGERVPLPVGDYELEDGNILVIAEEGVAAEIKPMEEAPEEEAELADDEMGALIDQMKKHFGLAEMKASLTELKAENVAMKLQLTELGEKPATTKVNLKSAPKKVAPTVGKNKQANILAYMDSKN
jgi:regulator of replication initiation timing